MSNQVASSYGGYELPTTPERAGVRDNSRLEPTLAVARAAQPQIR